MMIAEVGGIVNVSGSRMATPLAPPRPGSTPMITPSTMPIIISSRLNGVSTTAKPWNSALISSKGCSGPPDCDQRRELSSPRKRSGSKAPLNSGTLNQTSNITKAIAMTATPMPALFAQWYLPEPDHEAAMNRQPSAT